MTFWDFVSTATPLNIILFGVCSLAHFFVILIGLSLLFETNKRR